MKNRRKKWDDKYRKNNIEKCREAVRVHYQKNIDKERKRSLIKNRKSRKEQREKWIEYSKKYEKSDGRIFVVYKRNAKKRGIRFEITKDEFLVYIGKSCMYCGTKARGVDRIDNKKGYVVGNIGPCCGVCNHMKKDLTENEFKKHCKMIVDYGR